MVFDAFVRGAGGELFFPGGEIFPFTKPER